MQGGRVALRCGDRPPQLRKLGVEDLLQQFQFCHAHFDHCHGASPSRVIGASPRGRSLARAYGLEKSTGSRSGLKGAVGASSGVRCGSGVGHQGASRGLRHVSLPSTTRPSRASPPACLTPAPLLTWLHARVRAGGAAWARPPARNLLPHSRCADAWPGNSPLVCALPAAPACPAGSADFFCTRLGRTCDTAGSRARNQAVDRALQRLEVLLRHPRRVREAGC